ncbi:MAG: M15 family metallopeptidase [Cytophagales bacterium]|nr:M15 family metallopeptidase [Bernardetiaceae bacterium]MDW8204773.1 M15 family metallopeptidase [Cytophagales bacterium]
MKHLINVWMLLAFTNSYWAIAQPNLQGRYAARLDTSWVELLKLDSTFVLDVKYATQNNFTGEVLYDCGKVFLRRKVAEDLVQAHQTVKAQGYRMKIFDGYRPLSVQWRMWQKTPNKNYVADPRKGSMHNRGCAVDLTLVDASGKELDMGTPYDFFGKEAHLDYPHNRQVQENRKILQNAMKKHNFRTIKTEWWHFSHRNLYPISNFPLPCQ